jgi:hypothetical protein
MGLKKIYLDSCIAIYAIEAHPLYAAQVTAAVNADLLFAAGAIGMSGQAVTNTESSLAKLVCSVLGTSAKPLIGR